MRQDQVIISVKGAYLALAPVERVASVRHLLNSNPERDLEIRVWLPFLKTYSYWPAYELCQNKVIRLTNSSDKFKFDQLKFGTSD
jgi:hypothetical protein